MTHGERRSRGAGAAAEDVDEPSQVGRLAGGLIHDIRNLLAGTGVGRKLLEAAYAKGRSDGMQEAVQGIAKAAAKIGVKVEVQRTPAGVRQAGSKRTQ